MSQTIKFYRVDDDYGCFSNFAAYPILLEQKLCPTSEHFFQAKKFAGPPLAEEIRNTISPMDAARLGHNRDWPLRSDWDEVKDDIMRRAVYAKFCQHSDLRKILLATGEAEIVEHTINDNYWGDGGDGSGRNMLGQILMQVRQLCKTNEPLVETWRDIVSNPSDSWVLFKNGSCVFIDEVADNLAASAAALMAEWGAVQVATPSADFGCIELADKKGWVVTCHSNNILTYVSAQEVPGDKSDVSIGLTGRCKRELDANELVIIHIEDGRRRAN